MRTIILQKKVCRVSFFVLQEFLNYLPSRLFLLLCSPRLIFFQCIFVLSTRFIPQNWKVLNFVNKFSISLIVEVHGVNGVGEGAVSLIHFYLLKYQNCITSALRDQAFLQFVPRACFKKPLKNIRKMYRTSVPAIRNFILTFFCFDDVQMPAKREV